MIEGSIKAILAVIALLFFVGCTTIPEDASGRFSVAMSKEDTVALTKTLVSQCWVEKENLLVNWRVKNDRVALTAGGIPFFFVAVISGSEESSDITTHEGDFRCDFGGCWSLKLTDDIKRWSMGDHTCRLESFL